MMSLLSRTRRNSGQWLLLRVGTGEGLRGGLKAALGADKGLYANLANGVIQVCKFTKTHLKVCKHLYGQNGLKLNGAKSVCSVSKAYLFSSP